ncbi:MAG: hypothetical protein NZM43_08515 [Saprospiraceae bacterium]|nr:hypothetical protein [Saprospiraceae bacterium]MDW8484353.1 hypothetical protein [Saprospiraceae bacterium]
MRCCIHYAPLPKEEVRGGRPKKCGDRFSARNPDTQQLPCIASEKSHRAYAGVAYVKSIDRLFNNAILNGRR